MSDVSDPARKTVEKKPLTKGSRGKKRKCICVVAIEWGELLLEENSTEEQKMRLQKAQIMRGDIIGHDKMLRFY